MSTYKKLHGRSIIPVAANFSDSGAEGQIWFNSVAGEFKSIVASGAWSSSSPQTTQREGGTATMGTLTAGLIAGGSHPAAPFTTATEEYNGSGWETGGNLGTGRNAYGGAGTQTAGLTAGGYTGSNVTVSESYNGTSWSEGPDINTARRASGTCGTQTAGLLVGGYTSSPVKVVEEYDGSSWTTVNSAPTNNYSAGMAGIQTSAIQIAGATNPGQACFEYDGTNWTTGGSLNTGRSGGGYSGTTQDSAMAISGETPPGPKTVNCEQYDGTTWTEVSNVATARVPSGNSPSGTKTDAYFSGGQSGVLLTEEFNTSANVITAAAWSSGGNLNTAREMGGVAGTTPAGIYMAGKTYPNTYRNETEEYNGTSWAEQNNVSTARTAAGAGTQTAGLIFGGTNGAPGSTGVQSATEEYDGSSWTNGGSLSAARLNMYGAGLQTAAFGAGGIISTNAAVTTVEDYNGSAWTSGTAMPAAQQGGGSAGLPSARLVFGGYSPYSAVTLEGDGEGWTAGGNMNQARGILAGFGSQTDAIAAGGSVNPNANSALAEGYDGTSWSTRPSLATARQSFAPSGSYNTSTSGFVAGGSQQGNPQNAQTEEWNVETTAVNIKKISTS